MTGIVWGSTFESASIKLTDVINDYVKYGYEIEKVCKNKYSYYVIFTNGDNWSAIKANECCRGRRCNISYIERNIDYDIYRTIINPITTVGPFTAIRLYGEGDLHISNEPNLPF